MTHQNVCKYYKFGFCKYKDNCRKMHIHEKCENRSCEIKNCTLRHPRKCSFYRDFKRCKFNEWCKYDHFDNDNDVQILRNQLDENKRKIHDLEEKIKSKDKDIEDQILRIESIEKSFTEEIVVRLETLEKSIIEKDKVIQELVNKVESFEKKIPVDKLICKLCSFEAKSVSGLKVHMRRKHTYKDIETFPIKCDFCDELLENRLKLKRHMKEHSYINAKYKCVDCDYFCKSELEMEVHIGKDHSDGFECGLCNSTENTLENLEVHFLTCEIFVCGDCDERIKTLDGIKKHINEEHSPITEYSIFFHSKLSTDNFSEVKTKSHYFKYL